MKAVLILGHSLTSQDIHPELKGRMDIGIKVFRETSADYLILSGGTSNKLIKIPECEVMSKYAVMSGIAHQDIIIESSSLDTLGNAYFTLKILNSLKKEIKNIFVISSCYHMERVEYIFSRCWSNEYAINYQHCFAVNGDLAHEQNSLKLAKEFFNDIEQGDLDSIRKKLFTSHALYKTKIHQ